MNITVVFDIGRTNKKYILFDDNFKVVEEVSESLPETTDEDGFPTEDLNLLTEWVTSHWQKILEKTQLLELVMSLDIELKDVVARHFDEIYERFIWVPWNLYPAKWRNDVSDF